MANAHGYDFAAIEPKWQRYWEERRTFSAAGPGEPGFDPARPKQYILDFFPYPSGAGLHVGHPEGYTATDIVARTRRMQGFNVLHPMGWDAFGLPAEQYALETNTHPRVTTQRNIERFRAQLKRLGFSYDWSREFATTDEDYYRWTQWIFLQMYLHYFDADEQRARPIADLVRRLEAERLLVRFDGELVPAPPAGLQQVGGIPPGLRFWHELSPDERRAILDGRRLAYLAEVPVNWCPALGTVLANEEVTAEGRSERGDFPVFRRPLRQWMLRITAYADRLERDLEPLDWPESVKLMQRNWIGRSEGADVVFRIEGSDETLTVFTTRPDTLYGATYMVFAPEHPLVESLTAAPQRDAVGRYVEAARAKTDLARTAEAKEKTGVFIGAYALNPVWPDGDPRARIPIWAADYVLMGYGTGAIMAVPGHDTRDLEFARSFDLPVAQVVEPAPGVDWQGYVDDGVAVNSPPSDLCGTGLSGTGPCGTGVSPVRSIKDQEHVTQRNLPHIQEGGETYFITFRSRIGTLSPTERKIVLDSCDFWHGRKMTLHCGVVMPDHVHLIMTPHERSPGEWYALAELLHSMKSYSAHQIATERGHIGSPVWMDESFDRLIRDEREFVEKWEYIRANPVTARLVKSPEDYPWLICRQFERRDTVHRRDAGATSAGRRSAGTCDFNDLPTPQAKEKIIAWLEERRLGRRRVNYKLRDWLFSRQRYWGEPFPIVHCPTCGPVALPEDELPVTLPRMDDFRPEPQPEESQAEPQPPLARAGPWTRAACPECGRAARRELNTMPNWAGSCWYYLRFIDPRNDRMLCDPEKERYWMTSLRSSGEPHVGGIDLYLGGAEHAVLHLLYARFWHKFLYDLGRVSTPEPFGRLFNQGMIRAFAYRDSHGVYYAYDEIDFGDDGAYARATGERLESAVEKMSKSLKNVINPDDVVSQSGADALRLYEMFMGPLDAGKPWNPRDVPGVFRFLQRVWRLVVDPDTGRLAAKIIPDAPRVSGREAAPSGRSAAAEEEPDLMSLERALHRTIKRVTDDLERMAFNTAIAAMMEFVNEATRAERIGRHQIERFVLLLSPFAPHLCEELWQRLRGEAWRDSLAYEPWPTWDEALTREEELEIAVQINGKLATTITVPADADEEAMRAAALADQKVSARLGQKPLRKVIVVKGRLINLVVG